MLVKKLGEQSIPIPETKGLKCNENGSEKITKPAKIVPNLLISFRKISFWNILAAYSVNVFFPDDKYFETIIKINTIPVSSK